MATYTTASSSSLIGSRRLASSFNVGISSLSLTSLSLHQRRTFRGLLVKAATVVAPKYKEVKPLGDRVLVKVKTAEEKTGGGILLPTTAVSKPQAGEVVAVGEGKTIGKNKVDITVKPGSQVVYSKYAGTELEFNGSNHMLLKEDDLVGILETDDIKNLKPLNDRVLIKVTEAEEKTQGGLYLTDSAKEKPSVGTVIAVGPGVLDEEGNTKPLTVTAGNTRLMTDWDPKLVLCLALAPLEAATLRVAVAASSSLPLPFAWIMLMLVHQSRWFRRSWIGSARGPLLAG